VTAAVASVAIAIIVVVVVHGGIVVVRPLPSAISNLSLGSIYAWLLLLLVGCCCS